MESTNRSCLICGRIEPEGITLLGRRICSGCEKLLVDLPVEDPDYDRYLAKLKSLWPDLSEERDQS
ncbi:MAG: sigma factor G inhibitor Gin [Firmicutes bacterium]|nr:sigma factor G inhibitor Gin [Bacillota bacterium]